MVYHEYSHDMLDTQEPSVDPEESTDDPDYEDAMGTHDPPEDSEGEEEGSGGEEDEQPEAPAEEPADEPPEESPAADEPSVEPVANEAPAEPVADEAPEEPVAEEAPEEPAVADEAPVEQLADGTAEEPEEGGEVAIVAAQGGGETPTGGEEAEDEAEPSCEFCSNIAMGGGCSPVFHNFDGWPSDAELFQTAEDDKLLLTEKANSIAVQTFLTKNSLPFKLTVKSNADFMSPSGKSPCLKCGTIFVSDFQTIVEFIRVRGYAASDVSATDKADIKVFCSSFCKTITGIELYVCLYHSDTYCKVTKPCLRGDLPWPVSTLVCRMKVVELTNEHNRLGCWRWKSLDDVIEEFDALCSTLQDKLGSGSFFFGGKFSEADALVYGHLFAILTTYLPLPNHALANTIRNHRPLIDFVKSIDSSVFQRDTNVSKDNFSEIEECGVASPPSSSPTSPPAEIDEQKTEEVAAAIEPEGDEVPQEEGAPAEEDVAQEEAAPEEEAAPGEEAPAQEEAAPEEEAPAQEAAPEASDSPDAGSTADGDDAEEGDGSEADESEEESDEEHK